MSRYILISTDNLDRLTMQELLQLDELVRKVNDGKSIVDVIGEKYERVSV
ncbi:hypothetical protein G4V62_13965 [Bacillaceae bacterium SIJ1]|nr:hypothetical protein [Litoribacterium kuwaitense]NGP46000.1 hypothetical protein [Litoribacterium kuwaitense]